MGNGLLLLLLITQIPYIYFYIAINIIKYIINNI